MKDTKGLPLSTGQPDTSDERKGLLWDEGDDDLSVQDEPLPSASSSRRRKCCSITLIALILSAIAVPSLYFGLRAPRPVADFNSQKLRSNGTHQFRKTSLIVSIDGLRADYLDRGLTPHLLAIAKKGLRAKSMRPVFPTLTFPNHWALMTGLYAESHGIVANNFWDPQSHSEFHYNRVESCWNSSWWFGEPMWETAENAGIVTANLMWPGPPVTRRGVEPTYFVPWKDHVPLKEKHDQIMEWIDLPLEKRPQLIMAYEPSLDQAGHLAGPKSDLVNRVLKQVDVFAKDIHDSLEARNLTDIIDVVFVSDHGMTDTSHPDFIYIDDILGDGFRELEHVDGWPAMGLRFSPKANTSYYLDVLTQAAVASSGKFDVFTHDTMPSRYHFSYNERIAPIYVVPRIGYVLTDRVTNDTGLNKGSHGYDNAEPSMHAMFVAHGPFSSVVKAIKQTDDSRFFKRRLLRPNLGWHSTANDTYVMDTFQNVEIYSLMVKLLGIEGRAAATNGTRGFWDKYF
ncbi:phosphodiesterase domain-containing protein [Phanerochaete sordida]|uniref:Phosphodiesterase domain-containing protein n=1 Tax=Phanerochaete sordida TaxID=48140 RepID=A0A9P3GNY2_9APHY|nr:phosphodiesterase domain-containing protein [Phanerochaete sordida]